MKKASKTFKTIILSAFILALCFSLTACSSNGTSAEKKTEAAAAEKNLKIAAVNSYTTQLELDFEGGIQDILNIDFLEVYEDGTYKLVMTSNGYARWINMSVTSHVAELYGTWTEGENSDEYSLFAALSAPTRVIAYTHSIADSETTPPVDSSTLSGDALTALLGEYSQMSVEIDYATGNYTVQ